jgi:hypothetical protein
MSDAWVALAGTGVGAFLSYVFQRLNMNKAAQTERAERLRTERIAAYSEFAGILFEYRRAQVRRWNLVLSMSVGAELEAAEDESRRCRAQAWTALLRVKLLSDTSNIGKNAEHALTLLREFAQVGSVAELDHQAGLARQAIEEFVEVARAKLAV